jgi:CubicO group peptidase (beta-lactamase class C family)
MPKPERFDRVAALLRDAIAARAFPAAAIEVGRHDGARWNEACGNLTYDPGAPPATPDTIFDLASLTKVLATTTIAMQMVDAAQLSLDEPVAGRLPEWAGADRASVTIADLLAHTSGLTAYLPFFRDYTGRYEFQRAICSMPLEYQPRTASVYSDLGFILLGFILEDAAASQRSATEPVPSGAGATLSDRFRRIAAMTGADPLQFHPPRSWRDRTAPTEIDPWRGRLLAGEVHDENAWALGGAAGHAGLFGTSGAVGAFARAVLRTIRGDHLLARTETMRRFARRVSVPGSSRALGWDTMLPTSSCGTRMSPSAIGHTGFTGTSLWIDWERDLYVVLLTNRVHPTRGNDAIRRVRPAVHDGVLESLIPYP